MESVAVALDELALACRMTGHSLDDLWVRYLATGGNRSRSDLTARLAGAAWPEAEERVLQVAVDDALRDLGLPPLTAPGPLAAHVDLPGCFDRLQADDGPLEHRAALSSTGPSAALDLRLRELLDLSARTRATARMTRAWARSVRLDEKTSRRRSPGGT
jgi:hypothetical protein